jgi:hypothetical protein
MMRKIKKDLLPSKTKKLPMSSFREYLCVESIDVVDEFIKACQALDIERIRSLFKKHPHLIDRIDPDDGSLEDPHAMPFLDRVKEIFEHFTLDGNKLKSLTGNAQAANGEAGQKCSWSPTGTSQNGIPTLVF